MNILPGEPVPPGFEDEVNRVAEIQPAIDQYKGNALIGLEYALELHDEERREPGYYCALCDKRGDPRTIMQHWTSFNHRMKYLEKHYPSAMRECNPVKYKPNSSHIMILVVQNLAEAIEDHNGRQKPAVYTMDDYRRAKMKIISDTNAAFHYDESNGPNFLNVVDRTLQDSKISIPKKSDQTLQITIKAPKRLLGNSASEISHRDGLDEISSDSDGPQDTNKKSKKREQSPAYRIVPRVHRSPPFDNDLENENKKLPTPKELSLQASHIAQERYKWEKYRCMLEIQVKQMEKIQQDYEKSPEKHPLYPEEWKKFWNRRYKELQAEKKIDPNKYDYKPEWIVFWTKRMKDLFGTELEKKKKEIKVKLGLSEDAEEMVDSLKEKYKVQITRPTISHSGMSNSEPSNLSVNSKIDSKSKIRKREIEKVPADVIDISDDDDLSLPQNRLNSSRSRSRSRSRKSRSTSPHSRYDYKRARRMSNSRSKSPISDEYGRYNHSRPHSRHRSGRVYPSTTESDFYGNASYTRSRHHGSITTSHYVSSIPTHSATSTSYRVLDPHQYPKYERSPTPHSKSASVKEDPELDNDSPLTVVAVLRLLTALEDHLGSLGPKVVDLLGKALALEKVKANSADDLLLNEDHCVFFETIKEKLKGLLIADVLDDQQKIRAVKKAIKNIATVVHQVTTKGKRTDAEINVETTGSNEAAEKIRQNKKITKSHLSVKDLPFDRQIVATKLAAALVIQGREDVSTDDMDKLIFFFVLMVKLSKERRGVDDDRKTLLTKDILPELGIPLPKSVISKTAALALASLPPVVDQLFESEISVITNDVDEEISNDTSDKDSKHDPNSSTLESLTDSDLQTLLQNFKHLSTEEQHHLIAHLKKLETADPARVEKLRKFVNVTDVADATTITTRTSSSTTSVDNNVSNLNNKAKLTDAHASTLSSCAVNFTHTRRYEDSPTNRSNKPHAHSNYSDDESERRRGVNISNPNKFSLDDEDEDDDYNFDDVFKAASSNVKRITEHTRSHLNKSSNQAPVVDEEKHSNTNEPILPVESSPNALTFNPAGLKISLSDTQNIIANLMGSLQQSNANQGTNSPSTTPIAVINKSNAVTVSTPQPVPPITGHISTNSNSATNSNSSVSMPSYYHQQQNQQPHGQQFVDNAASAGYNNQFGGIAAYYGSYSDASTASSYAGYAQSWLNGQQMQSSQQFGIQNFMTQQQQQQQQQMSYNMYGSRGNN